MSNLSSNSSSKKITTTLKKAIGSIVKALELVEKAQEFHECKDILIQLDSAIGSLKSGRGQILECFLKQSLDENLNNNDIDSLKKKLNQLYKLIKN